METKTNENTTANSAENNQNQVNQQQTVEREQQKQENRQKDSFNSSETTVFVDDTNYKEVVKKAAEEKETLKKEIRRLNEIIDEKDAKLVGYRDIGLLSMHGFNPDEYEDIKSLCGGRITEEKLIELKGKRQYSFLLDKRNRQQSQRIEKGDDILFGDLLKEAGWSEEYAR